MRDEAYARPQPLKIDIVGWYNGKNVGDEAFKYAHPQFFASHDINYVTPPNQCRPEADIIVLGGGAVVAPFYLEILPANKPKYALGVDIAYLSEIDLLAAADFQGAMVRNSTDLPTMQQKLHCPVRSIPDLAFCIQKESYSLEPSTKKKMGVLVTDYVNPAIDRPIAEFAERAWDFKIKMAKRLDGFIKQGWEVYLIPCATGGYGNDIRINLDLMSFMERQPICIMETIRPPQMIDLLSQMDINICMRFHAHIFSVMAGVPLVSIEFTRKVKLFLEENDLTSLTGARFDGGLFMEDLEKAVETSLSGNYQDRFKALALRNKEELELAKQQVRSDWLKESL